MTKFFCMLMVCCIAMVVPSLVFADQELAPYTYVTASELGRYYFKLVPGQGTENAEGAAGTCFQVEQNGNDKVLWTTKDWYAFKVYLSMDGHYLVRLGNWPRGHEPAAEHLAVAFYKDGVLLKSYSTKDLIKDLTAVRPSASHYSFYTGTPVFTSTYDGGSFSLTSVDGITYSFDIRTGEITWAVTTAPGEKQKLHHLL